MNHTLELTDQITIEEELDSVYKIISKLETAFLRTNMP